jgi:hypothetical protein
MAAALHAKQLGEPPRGLGLRHPPNGSGEADYVAALLTSCEVAPNASSRAMQSDAQAAARLAGQAAAGPLAADQLPAREPPPAKVQEMRQSGAVDGGEV